MREKIGLLFAVLLLSIQGAFAQITFSLNGADFNDVAYRNTKGMTTVTLPAGTSLEGIITGVKIDGTDVDASAITPNPLTTKIKYGETKVFTHNNRAFGFVFEEDLWFCGVFISDCHINQGSGHDGTSTEEMKRIMNSIIAIWIFF